MYSRNKEATNKNLCHFKQVIGANKLKREVPNGHNISEIITNRSILMNGPTYWQRLKKSMLDILKGTRHAFKHGERLRFQKGNYAKNVASLLPQKGIIQTILNLLKSDFYVPVVIGKES